MARYFGRVGYATQVEIRPGVYEDVIEERQYFGTVTKDYAKWAVNAERLHKDFSLSNVISIISDPYLDRHIQDIRYIEWMGTLWSISDVEIMRPRLEIRLGGVYHGPTAKQSDSGQTS